MPDYKDACPDCGGLKKTISVRCRACSAKLRSIPCTCPLCGGKKAARARACPSCRASSFREAVLAKTFDHLEPLWCACFAGLFMGEGSLIITKDPRNGGSYHVRASIHMRADEKSLFDDIQAALGGTVYPEKRAPTRSAPQLVWATNDTASVYALCRLLKKYTPIPAKKLRDADLVMSFCEWRVTQPRLVADWTVGEEIYNRLLKSRKFSENG